MSKYLKKSTCMTFSSKWNSVGRPRCLLNEQFIPLAQMIALILAFGLLLSIWSVA